MPGEVRGPGIGLVQKEEGCNRLPPSPGLGARRQAPTGPFAYSRGDAAPEIWHITTARSP